MYQLFFFDAAQLAALGFTIFQLSFLGKAVMSHQEIVNGLVAQVAKVKTEVIAARDVLTARLADVQAALDAAGVPADQVDLSALQAAVQDLDDINPDPVVEPPFVEEPVVEPVVDPVVEPVVEEPVVEQPTEEPQDSPPF